MPVSLENFIRNELHDLERMQLYSLPTDTVRCWLDFYIDEVKKQSEQKKLQK